MSKNCASPPQLCGNRQHIPPNVMRNILTSCTITNLLKIMKQILVLIFITVLLACHRPKEQEKYFNSLPNNDLINEIIKATIRSNSLLFENGISKKLTNILVCKYELNLNDSIPIPPPPPNGIYLHTLLQLLNSNTSTDQLYNNSIFYFLQSNRARNI